ncbi:MAG: adenylate cyclase [Cereibacter sphaeroides]|uniref:Adenylate cyclase n=1 Tax=Cereibacter sphaeroides TaxID=1063 RepID=A0A2W5S4Z5_CERSP|nr:MAG: adenylate cyclase [Cereibacter sphaeroides]
MKNSARIRAQAIATQAAQRLSEPAQTILGYQELIVEELRREGQEGARQDAKAVLKAARSLDVLVAHLVNSGGAGADEAKLRHDLRTPVNAILGYSELLLEEFTPVLAETTKADIAKVIAECGRFLLQVDGLLDLSRGAAEMQGTESDADIAVSLERTLESVATVQVQGGRILVIDDAEANRDLMRRQLVQRGHVVEVEASAAAALARMATADFDVLLVDILMPDMNGIELLAKLKNDTRLREIPVIMVSGLKETSAVVRCIAAGAEDYLQKPIDPILLHSRVGASLDRVRWTRREKEFQVRIKFERDRADALLHTILPAPIIRRLNDGATTIADRFDAASIIFADFVDFTALVTRTEPHVLVRHLSEIFSAFDDLADRHGIEKIKTIGDAYMAAAGIPEASPDHARRALDFGRDMIRTANEQNSLGLAVRVGINCGPVIAGLIGRKRFVYDVWGDTVNLASRLESSGSPGRIHISESAHAALAGFITGAETQVQTLKGLGRVRSYLVD